MYFTELSAVPDVVLPLAALKQHLRLGTGFADDDLMDDLLMSVLRSAVASIEARTGKALFQRDFLCVFQGWQHVDYQTLPIAPIASVSAVVTKSRNDDVVADIAGDVRLIKDPQRPRLVAMGACLPVVPSEGSVEVTLTAGFSADWDGLKPDLQQAILMLAGFTYEHRMPEMAGDTAWPAPVAGLLSPYLTVRLFEGVQK